MPRIAEKNRLADNELAIKAAKARDGKPTEYRIAGLDYVVLRVMPPHEGEKGAGRATFYMRYTANGARKYYKVEDRGHRPTWKEVRNDLKKLGTVIAEGGDPFAVQLAKSETDTLRTLWEKRKADDIATGSRSPKTLKDYEAALELYAFKRLGDMPASEITPDHIAGLLRTIEGHSRSQAHNVRCAIGSTYKWAYRKRLVDNVPTRGLGFIHKAKVRVRHADPEAIKILWKAIDAGTGLSRRMRIILKLVILTGQRNSTVTKTRVDELRNLDTATALWHIEVGRMKDRDHAQLIPLTAMTTALFREAIALNKELGREDSDYLFPVKGRNEPMEHTSTSHAMERVRELVMAEAAKRGEPVDIDYTPHDFKKFINTILAEHRVDADIRKQISHHDALDTNTKNYNFARLFGPVKDAFEMWERYVLGEGQGASGGNVVSMASARA